MLVYAVVMGSSDIKTGDLTIRKIYLISSQVRSKYCTETRSKYSTVKFQMQRKTNTDHSRLVHSRSQVDSCTPSRDYEAMQNDFITRLNMVQRKESD